MNQQKNNYLNDLINNKLVYFIYLLNNSLFGINGDDKKYIVIVDDKFMGNKEQDYSFYTISDWYKMIDNNDIQTWECLSLKKRSNVLKEYIKLTYSKDLIKLRNNLDKKINNYNRLESKTINDMINLIMEAEFCNQIFESGKIVNYKVIGEYYSFLNVDNEPCRTTRFGEVYKQTVKLFENRTDGMLAKRIKDKVVNE